MTKNELDMEKPYCDDLKGILSFSDFDETEKTIRQLEKKCRKYLLRSILHGSQDGVLTLVWSKNHHQADYLCGQ